MMRPIFIMLILFVIAMLATLAVYFPFLEIAKRKNIVDAPSSERKQQKMPVPVIGGVTVFFGVIIGLCFFKTTVSYVNLIPTIGAMTLMLYIGTIDDILDIKASIKFLLEIIVSLLLIYGTRNLVRNFQGLAGIETMSVIPAIVFSVLVIVTIINSINLMDGVDGLSSGFCIYANSCFALFFFLIHDYTYAAIAIISVGATIPFFIHNLLGKDTKMYFGDGGTLMMGVLLASMCLNISSGKEFNYEPMDLSRFSVLSFCMAVLALPCFDAVRVMFERIIRGKSPFSPDRLHFHHILLDCGLTPIKTTLLELFLGVIPLAAFVIACLLSVPIWAQMLIVFAVSLLIVVLPSFLLRLRKGL